MRKRFPVLLAVALVAAVLGALAPSSSSAAPRSPGAATLGMRPSGGFLKAGRLAQYEQELGGQINWYVGFAGRKSPQAMRSAVNGQLKQSDAVLPTVADRMNLVMTVPLAFGKQTAKTEAGRAKVRTKLAETASGAWDNDYRAIARSLIDGGYPDAVIRLGHEFTGAWFPWSAQGNPDAYIAAYQHVHGVLRAMSPDFRFEWNASRNTFREYGPPAYPGDAYVDVVGLDVYYRPFRGGKTMAEGAWESSFLPALRFHQQFAAANGKPVAYSEWAAGGTDEPAFVQAMHDWLASLPSAGPGSLAYHSYFNVNQSLYNLDGHPEAKQRYIALFGGTGDAGAPSPAELFAPDPGSGGGTPPPDPGDPPPPPAPDPGDPTTVDAPASLSAVRGEPTTIDIDSNASSFQWWKVSGPGGISWVDRQAEDVVATFRASGVYEIAVRANGSGGTARATITVTVGEPGGQPAPPPDPGDGGGSLPALSIRGAEAEEGSVLVFKLVLDQVAADDVTVDVATTGLSATEGEDFGPRQVTVVIPAGERRAFVGVATKRDNVAESSEDLRLRATAVSGATIRVGSARGIIHDA